MTRLGFQGRQSSCPGICRRSGPRTPPGSHRWDVGWGPRGPGCRCRRKSGQRLWCLDKGTPCKGCCPPKLGRRTSPLSTARSGRRQCWTYNRCRFQSPDDRCWHDRCTGICQYVITYRIVKSISIFGFPKEVTCSSRPDTL